MMMTQTQQVAIVKNKISKEVFEMEAKKVEKSQTAPQNGGKGKRVTSILLLVLASILVVLMVLINIVPKNFAPKLEKPNSIKVYTDNLGSDGREFDSGTEEYKKIMSLCDDGFKVTIMSALVQGKLFESETLTQSTVSNPQTKGNVTIQFVYDEPQTIVVNGKQAETSLSNQYYVATIVVTDSTDLETATVYYNYYTSNSSSTTSRYNLTTYAHFSALYNYLQNM